MCFVAVREGLSEEVSHWLRTEEHRKDRHEKSEKKGIHTMGITYKDQHTKKGAVAEGQAAQRHVQARPSCHLSVPPAPPPCPLPLRLCSPDNSKQTGLTLGLVTMIGPGRTGQHRSPGLCEARTDKGCARRGGWGQGDTEQPSKDSCIPQADSREF